MTMSIDISKKECIEAIIRDAKEKIRDEALRQNVALDLLRDGAEFFEIEDVKIFMDASIFLSNMEEQIKNAQFEREDVLLTISKITSAAGEVERAVRKLNLQANMGMLANTIKKEFPQIKKPDDVTIEAMIDIHNEKVRTFNIDTIKVDADEDDWDISPILYNNITFTIANDKISALEFDHISKTFNEFRIIEQSGPYSEAPHLRFNIRCESYTNLIEAIKEIKEQERVQAAYIKDYGTEEGMVAVRNILCIRYGKND